MNHDGKALLHDYPLFILVPLDCSGETMVVRADARAEAQAEASLIELILNWCKI